MNISPAHASPDKSNWVPLPDDPELTRRPGYDFAPKMETMKHLQIVEVITPKSKPPFEALIEKLFAKLNVR
jgi:hypothetical protein